MLKRLWNWWKTASRVKKWIFFTIDLVAGFAIIVSEHPEIIGAWAGANIGLWLHKVRTNRRKS